MSLKIIFHKPDDDELSVDLRRLTRLVHESGKADGSPGGIFGGEWGYGVNFENDVFMMHRFCWCESDDCLWCSGSRCQMVGNDWEHAKDCFWTELYAAKNRFEENIGFNKANGKRWRDLYKQVRKYEDTIRKELTLKHSQRPSWNEDRACSCGEFDKWKKQYDACKCDWHVGAGRFIYGLATDAPHFWHKATRSSVRWYKYIGRGMEADIKAPWLDIVRDCMRSLES